MTYKNRYIKIKLWLHNTKQEQGHWYENAFYILMQMKLILTRKVLHLASFWKWEFLELGNGLKATLRRRVMQINKVNLLLHL